MRQHDWIDDAIEKAARRTRGIAREVTDFPHIAQGGVWQTTPDGVWTGGFWAGLLWLASGQAGHEGLREVAAAVTDRLLPRAFDTHNHDLGFMFYPSAVTGWRLTREQRYLEAAHNAAVALATQFNPQAGFIPGWGFFGNQEWTGSVLVDTLMNLPLLVWAVQQGGDADMMRVVRAQVALTLKHHLRKDGSVYHIYRFDPATGAPLGGDTYQGFAAESAWARGQAWAITALAILAAMTGDRNWRSASERVAAFFLTQLPEDGVPPWDFSAPGDQPKDSSAGAIAAYGFQRLHGVTGDPWHLEAATRLLRALAEACGNESAPGGLLLHATADLPHDLAVDGSTMYGDYYYFKSLVGLRELIGRP